MQRSLVIAFVIALALGLGIYFAKPSSAPKAAAISKQAAAQHPGTMTEVTDGRAIFRRAMWRSLGKEDHLVHAIRREWTEKAEVGVARWQWFLEVEASPDLMKYLRQDNALNLRPIDKADIPAPPDWFPADLSAYDLHATGSLIFCFDKSRPRFFATNQGKGFTPGHSLPQPLPAPSTPANSRIPNHPPPRPAGP